MKYGKYMQCIITIIWQYITYFVAYSVSKQAPCTLCWISCTSCWKKDFFLNNIYVCCMLFRYPPMHKKEGRKMFYLTMHSTHFIYGYMASDIWLRTTQMAREETRWRHMGYVFRLAARVVLYASSHRQDNTHYNLCYTSCGALAGIRNSSMGPPWRKEMFYLTTHSTHFIYSYMASEIWLRTILIVRKETRCRLIGYSFQQGFFYMHHPTDRIAHTMDFVTPVVEHWLEREIAQPHEGSIRWPIAPWANALTTELHLALRIMSRWSTMELHLAT